jgi:hypothetical protein
MRALWIAGLLGVASSPARAEIACFSGPMQPMPFNGSGVAGSGGVIIGSGEPMPDWRFRAGNRLVRGEVTMVAPGLAVFHPPPMVPGVELHLESLDGTLHVSAARALTAEPLPEPPVVESVVHTVNNARVFVTARFARGAPAHAAVAVIERVANGKTTPLAWSGLSPGTASVVLWHTPSYCDQTIPQAIEPKPGETVVVRWVDDYGRLSEASKPITISKAARGK